MTMTAERRTKSRMSRSTLSMMPTDIRRLILRQEYWTEKEYLELDNSIGAWMIELVDGRLEVLPMPTPYHQDILIFLLLALREFATARRLGRTYISPMPVHLFPGTMREPDIVFLKNHRLKNKHKPPEGADLVVEIVSPSGRKRDLKDKRADYAKAKVPEYWIVDPKKRTITVLVLSGKSYETLGVFKEGDEAPSKLIKGFKVAVSEVFGAGEGK
jgi:Uma2 family endonuclease